jgi:hypothetical protein
VWYFGVAAVYLDLMLLPAIVGCSFVRGAHDYDAVGTWAIAFTIVAFFIAWYVVSLADSNNVAKRAWQLDVLAEYGRHVFMCYTPIGWLLMLYTASRDYARDRVGAPIAEFIWTKRA